MNFVSKVFNVTKLVIVNTIINAPAIGIMVCGAIGISAMLKTKGVAAISAMAIGVLVIFCLATVCGISANYC